MSTPRLALVVPALVLVLTGCGGADPAVGATVDGASLSRLSLSDGSHAFLQRIDLTRMRLEQVVGDRDQASPEAGRYYPGSVSPRFTRITPQQARDECGADPFSIVNFAFFEEYDPTTRLSFPVKSRGAVLTGGSSPYGPVDTPTDPYYRGVTLRALTWSDAGAAIVAYQPGVGTPLRTPATTDALVTYAYRDHPSYVLSGDPPNRYQLLALADAQHLLILTVEHATLDAGAQLLRANGATGEILTFDGGVSTYLWQATLGELVSITNQDGRLPHYLCVRRPG
jgi:hypothetical protein